MSSPGPASNALGELGRLVVTLKSVRGGKAAADSFHQIHKSLSHGLDNLDEHRYMRAAHPAVGAAVLGGAVALAPLIAILVVAVLVVVGVVCLVKYGDSIQAWAQGLMLDAVMRTGISVAQARENVYRYVQDNPQNPECKPRYEEVMTALTEIATFATRRSGGAQTGMTWNSDIKRLLRAVEAALRGLVSCMERYRPPGSQDDAAGFLRRFCGSNGIIEVFIRNMGSYWIRP